MKLWQWLTTAGSTRSFSTWLPPTTTGSSRSGRRPWASQGARFPEYHWGELPGQDIELLVQRLDEGASRVHLDIHTTDIDAEVVRLEQLGATRIRQVHTWWIMQDPAGLQFCVIPDSAERLTDDNARRWD